MAKPNRTSATKGAQVRRVVLTAAVFLLSALDTPAAGRPGQDAMARDRDPRQPTTVDGPALGGNHVISSGGDQFFPGIGALENQDPYLVANGEVRPLVDGFLPSQVGLDAMDVSGMTRLLFSVSAAAAVNLDGAVINLGSGIYSFDLNTRGILTEVDWAAVGMDPGNVDALDELDDGTFAFSTASVRAMNFHGEVITLRPEDVYVFDGGAGTLTTLVDGSRYGLASIDAVTVLSPTLVAISTASNNLVQTPAGGIVLKQQNAYVLNLQEGTIAVALDGVELGLQSLDAMSLDVLVPGHLIELAVAPDESDLLEFGSALQLSVTGTFSDGMVLDLTDASEGTVYQSSDPAVATVDADGLVRAVGGGEVEIRAYNLGRSAAAQVHVLITVVDGTLYVFGDLHSSGRITAETLAVSQGLTVQNLDVADTVYAGNLAVSGVADVGTLIAGAAATQELAVNGTTTTSVLTITGGADLAEPMVIEATSPIAPGSIVVIDDEHPGGLRLSTAPYDRRVAGIVSGANGVDPGITLESAQLARGEHYVALTGRVYALASAANGPIAPGDLLTTSSIPGHAMKATDPRATPGSVIGKAMSALDAGSGLVLVLVGLQ